MPISNIRPSIDYGEKDGLPPNNFVSILEDQNGNIWFGSVGKGTAFTILLTIARQAPRIEIDDQPELMAYDLAEAEIEIANRPGSRSSTSWRCADLVCNGFDDWYLPALGELKAIYDQLGTDNLTGDLYWTQ